MNKWKSFAYGFATSMNLIAAIMVFRDRGFCPSFVFLLLGTLLWISNNCLEEK